MTPYDDPMPNFTPGSENPLDSESRPRKRLVQERTQPKLTPALYKALVKTQADSTTIKDPSSTAGMDDAILQRIKKCLQRANHENTPEPEAKAAFYLASRLMDQHNVSQAEVIAHEPPATQQQYAGQSIVSIVRADGSGDTVNNQGFVNDLASAMNTFFDCKCYSERRYASVDWTFYGIAENTIAAVMAFEMAYNLISEWARPHKGIASKNSYCIGVARELYNMAWDEKRSQERQARDAERDSLNIQVEHEEVQRQAELDRLAFSPSSLGEAAEDTHDELLVTEDDGDNDMNEDETAPDFVEGEFQVDAQAEFDDEIMRLVKPEPRDTTSLHFQVKSEAGDNPSKLGQASAPTSPTTPVNNTEAFPNHNAISEPLASIKEEDKDVRPDSTLTWKSSTQLTTFRANASRIAEDYLKGRGIKLCRPKSRSSNISDYSAYKQGKRDSKKIDIRRRKIEA
ncbi:Nn.00g042570.m01.CDS01 [Neocucurbitaria sp. VM-36]